MQHCARPLEAYQHRIRDPCSCLPLCVGVDEQWNLSELTGSPQEVGRCVLSAGRAPGRYSANSQRTRRHPAL